jgi:hypothetical protein
VLKDSILTADIGTKPCSMLFPAISAGTEAPENISTFIKKSLADKKQKKHPFGCFFYFSFVMGSINFPSSFIAK